MVVLIKIFSCRFNKVDYYKKNMNSYSLHSKDIKVGKNDKELSANQLKQVIFYKDIFLFFLTLEKQVYVCQGHRVA